MAESGDHLFVTSSLQVNIYNCLDKIWIEKGWFIYFFDFVLENQQWLCWKFRVQSLTAWVHFTQSSIHLMDPEVSAVDFYIYSPLYCFIKT